MQVVKLFYINEDGDLDMVEDWPLNNIQVQDKEDTVSLKVYDFNIKLWGKIQVAALRDVDAQFLAK